MSSMCRLSANAKMHLFTLQVLSILALLLHGSLAYRSDFGSLAAAWSNSLHHDRRGSQFREYEFTVARGIISPDGFQKEAILVNGQFPGPTIEANYGDTLSITVRNNITGPEEGTSIHWHGIVQIGTPYYDGVAAVSQCPIAPGKSMTYTFVADSYGSSFYHAHYSSQYIDGVNGPIIIHGFVVGHGIMKSAAKYCKSIQRTL